LMEWQVFLSNIVSSCVRVESFPRSVVSIIVQVQSADGSVLAACLHAAVAALMDAGIEMTCLPVAVACLLQTSIQQSSSSSSSNAAKNIDISLDPTLGQELRDETGLLCVVVSSSSSSSSSTSSNNKNDHTKNKNNNNNTILGCYSAGLKIHTSTLLQCCSLAERAAPAILAFWRLAVEQKTRREYQTLLASAHRS
jgi:3' exoribonuclease family, domain 1